MSCSGYSGFHGCGNFLPIKMVQGDTYVLYSSYAVGGLPVNITGMTITMICKCNPEAPDSAAIFTISTTTGDILITNGANGDFVITVPSSATLNVPAINFPAWYNVVLETPGSNYSGYLGFSGFSGLSGNGTYRATVFQGPFRVEPNALDS